MMGGSVLVESIIRVLAQDWRVVVWHTIRGNNRVIDMLAKRGRNLHMESSIFAIPPVDIVRIIVEEAQVSSQAADMSHLVGLVASFDLGGAEC
ncbi:hypothetical protein V6N13_059337 [Hibiscus sabdariffa]|uniref:RNase H type-1 domain-containing protein n=1 Tax=Hibiscus sabdariffa TaxID=183260 RepID=A0ABR2GDC3_9ROSI